MVRSHHYARDAHQYHYDQGSRPPLRPIHHHGSWLDDAARAHFMDNEFQQRSWRLRNAMASTYMAHCMYVRAWTLLPLPSDRDIAEGSEVIGNATAGEGHDDCPGPSSDKITEPHDLYETWGSAFSTPGTPYPRPHRTPCSNCDQNLHPEGRYQATILFRHRRRPNVDTDASATLMTLDRSEGVVRERV